MRRLAQLLFWLVLLGIAFVTLSSIAYRPETGFPPALERFGAFLLLGILGGLAYPRHRLAWSVALVAAAGGFEALQTLVPGRDGRWIDFAVKSAGAIAGGALALLGSWIGRDRRWRDGRGPAAPI